MEENVQIENEIENKRKLPEEVKNKIRVNFFVNIICSIVLMLLMLLINTLFRVIDVNKFIIYVKSLSIIEILATVFILEIAYRKDNTKIMFYGLELLVFSIITMYIPYIYTNFGFSIRSIVVFSPLYYIVYYIFKSLLYGKKAKKEYLNSLSDVKEILQEEEDGYLDEDSAKLLKKKKEQESKK